MRWLVPLLLVLAVAACRQGPPAPAAGALSDPGAAQAACLKGGGRWVPRGETGAMICLRTPRDAGDACSAAGDCEGQCLARSRTCAPVAPLFGCNEILDGSGRTNTLCVN